jgi:hypothetical protein
MSVESKQITLQSINALTKKASRRDINVSLEDYNSGAYKSLMNKDENILSVKSVFTPTSDPRSVNYSSPILITSLIKAVQDQKSEINGLNATVQSQQKEIDRMKDCAKMEDYKAFSECILK